MKIKSKLTSRKFWLTIISIVAGIAELFGADSDVISTVSGTAMALIPSVIYVITEGIIDVSTVKTASAAVADALNTTEK